MREGVDEFEISLVDKKKPGVVSVCMYLAMCVEHLEKKVVF